MANPETKQICDDTMIAYTYIKLGIYISPLQCHRILMEITFSAHLPHTNLRNNSLQLAKFD